MEIAQYYQEETLKSGRPVIIRAVHPDDKEAFSEGFKELSEKSIYHRFFSAKKHLTEKELAYFTEVDFEKHVALVAIMEDEGVWRLCGTARFVSMEAEKKPQHAEVAFVVGDRIQGEGLGTVLFLHLSEVARKCGIRYFEGDVLNENEGLLGVLRKSGLPIKKFTEGEYLHFLISLYPGEQ